MEKMLCKLLWGQLLEAGIINPNGSSDSITELLETLPNPYQKWMQHSFSILAQSSFLTLQEEGYIVNQSPPDIKQLWEEWHQLKSIWETDPDLTAKVQLAEAALAAIPDLLMDKRKATEVLFPNGSLDLVKGIYHQNPTADYYNHVLGEVIEAYLIEAIAVNPSARIRLLEVGAGTGGTTQEVLGRLKPYSAYIEEYCYTDLSKAFLIHAENEFQPNHPYLKCKILNIESPFGEQGVEYGSYDLLIGANVLHATKNIRHTIQNCKAALKRNGILVLNELVVNSIFTHITFGLLEGWWLYEDEHLRIKGTPCLSEDQWKATLEQEGFSSVFFAADSRGGQRIIVSESNGMVRLPLPTHSQLTPSSEGSTNSQQVVKEDPYLDLVQIKTAIKACLAKVLLLKKEKIEDSVPFYVYGLDSITGNHFIKEINDTLRVSIKITAIYDHSNVHSLARSILEEYPHLDREEADYIPSGSNADRLTPSSEPRNIKVDQQNLDTNHKHLDHSISDRASAAIAVIGISGRFPMSDDIGQLWQNLKTGKDLVGYADRWALRDKSPNRPNFSIQGGYLNHIDSFDASFFNITPEEAEYMDPQQRIFLEESWKALEDAGYANESVDGLSCGVYVGCQSSEYHTLYSSNPPAHSLWGRSASVIPARIAYLLNLRGPAISVDTACSSSLVAIHLACQGLWNGEMEMALAGGISLRTTPDFYPIGEKAGLISPEGRCFAFDNRANGFVISEGAGVLVLKPLDKAIAAGDHIYGVIIGSGLNQDGATNGIAAQSSKSQEELILDVYNRYGIDPSTIQFFEAHGTGTKIGDAIEFEGINRAFRKYTDKKQFCSLGSLKTNMGHTATASGVAGLIKILLSFKYKELPPTLHFSEENENINLQDSPFYINTALHNWNSSPSSSRRAAISSFGLSGTNAHMVLEEYPCNNTIKAATKPAYLIVLSARTREQLHLQAKRLLDHLRVETDHSIANVSYTLINGRKHFSHRIACVASSMDGLLTHLEQWYTTGHSEFVNYGHINDSISYKEEHIERANKILRDTHSKDPKSSYKDDLSFLGKLFVQGYPLQYGSLYHDETYFRTPLPTYPFSKERHWVQSKRENSSNENLALIPPSAANLEAEAVAVIGMSGQFPGSNNLTQYWSNLVSGANCLSKPSKKRVNWFKNTVNAPTLKAAVGGFLENLDQFDADFFKVSQEEAPLLDPQQRLLLMHTWKAIEDAGYSPTSLSGSNTAVFTAIADAGYTHLNPSQLSRNSERLLSSGPNRISQFLNLHGPSEPVETACSSSIVAVHRAVSAIQAGQSDTAIAGGVNLLLSPEYYLESPKGRSQKQDLEIYGEGVGVLFLKSLRSALADGDPIHAVIRGSLTNHMGANKDDSQAIADLLASTYRKANINPLSITYLESCFSGINDPAELEGHTFAFHKICEELGHNPSHEAYCGLGSVKGNMGNLHIASGMASIIKVILQLKHKKMVKNFHYKDIFASKELFQNTPLYPVKSNQEWKTPKDDKGNELPRRAGVTSLGSNGVNAHIVLEEHLPSEDVTYTSDNPLHSLYVFPLSAMTEAGVRKQAVNLLEATSSLQPEALPNLAYTLQLGRAEFDIRLAFVARSLTELQDLLNLYLSGNLLHPHIYFGKYEQDNELVNLISRDQDLKEALYKWLEKGKCSNIADLWVKGLHVDWGHLYLDKRLKRISLPTYSFEKKTYWYDF